MEVLHGSWHVPVHIYRKALRFQDLLICPGDQVLPTGAVVFLPSKLFWSQITQNILCTEWDIEFGESLKPCAVIFFLTNLNFTNGICPSSDVYNKVLTRWWEDGFSLWGHSGDNTASGPWSELCPCCEEVAALETSWGLFQPGPVQFRLGGRIF